MGRPKAAPKASRRPGRKTNPYEAKGVDPHTGKRKSYWGPTAEAASKAAWDSYGIQGLDQDTLYGFYATVYLPTILHRSDNWQGQVAWAMDKHVLPTFRNHYLKEIHRADVQRLFNRLPRHPLAESSIAKIKIVFSGVLNLAVRDGLIPSNPCTWVRIAPIPQPDKRALSFRELADLIDGVPVHLKPFAILAAFGLRAGEACASTRHNARDGVLKVRQQVLQPRGGAILSSKLKTPQSKRDLPLPTAAWDELLACDQVSDIFLCSSAKGGYMLPSNAYDDFVATAVALDLDPLSPHECRHTFISLMELELECPSPVVDELAGRKGTDYRHASREQKARWLTRYWEQIEKARLERKTEKERGGLRVG